MGRAGGSYRIDEKTGEKIREEVKPPKQEAQKPKKTATGAGKE